MDKNEFKATWSMGFGIAFILAGVAIVLWFLRGILTDQCFVEHAFKFDCTPETRPEFQLAASIMRIMFVLVILLGAIEIWRKTKDYR